jgi:hypothetical protein
MKINFKSKGKKHEDKVPWTSLVPAELARIKKAKISLTSKYWRPEKVHDYATSKYGFQHTPYDEESYMGTREEWAAAFKKFCKKKTNTKGQKVDRLALLKYNYNKSQF